MPRKKSKLLSHSEWKVMKIVWERKSCATRDICQEARKILGWSDSTVKTILRRLVDKGYLQYTQIGNSFLYRPARPALKSLLQAADILLDNALEGTTGPILAHMVKKGDLSKEEIQDLQKLLDDYAKKKDKQS